MILYLHGFASGPNSTKGVTVERHLRARGHDVERLNLRLPSLEHLRFSAMTAHVEAKLSPSTMLIGSSLGGLAAARVAERDARVTALVLLAPAFTLVDRWRARLGDEGWRAWQESDALDIEDYAEGRRTTVDFGFVRELEALDRGFPDVRVPTLIVHGVQDDTVDVALSRKFAAGKPHVRLVEVDDGHELVKSLPLICAELDTFLATFSAPRR